MPHLFSSADASALPKDPRDRGLASARVATAPGAVPVALPRFAMPDLESVDLDEVDDVDEVDADDRADITEVTSVTTSLRAARTEEAGGRNLRALRQVAVVPPAPEAPEQPTGWLRSLWRGKA